MNADRPTGDPAATPNGRATPSWPSPWCDVHHVRHWAHGGATPVENSALLCERHHTACHEGRFRVTRDPGTSQWRTYRPDGSRIPSRAGP